MIKQDHLKKERKDLDSFPVRYYSLSVKLNLLKKWVIEKYNGEMFHFSMLGTHNVGEGRSLILHNISEG